MKLLASLASATLAQGQLESLIGGDLDLGNFDLGTFGDFQLADEGERYFFTDPPVTVTTTTTTTTTLHDANHCWKCDQMTYSKCSLEGKMEKCPKGDRDCCFVEVYSQWFPLAWGF